MMAEDQAEQTGQLSTNNYTARTERLAEILDEHGWPSHDLVGEDGSTAAWVIARHADLDLELQQRALELLRAAAAIGQASGGDLAYLEDRVAVATGQPQRYGTQVGCGEDGTPVTATPLADAATVDDRRAEAGLPPLADYFAEMASVCATPDREQLAASAEEPLANESKAPRVAPSTNRRLTPSDTGGHGC